MLQDIRDKAQGWIAWAIVILISIPFALWGIQQYLGVGSEPVAATVNGQEIKERDLESQFRRFRQDLRERLGSAYRPEMFDDRTLRKEVLADMIRTDLVRQSAHEMGLRAADRMVQQTILRIPAFQSNGRFDRSAYERALQIQGMTPAQFENRLRASLVSAQLSQAVSASEFVTEREFDEIVRLSRQKRDVSYFVLPVSEFRSDDPIGDETVQSYYDRHQDRFRTPERVKLEYLVLDVAGIGTTVNPDEADLRQLYAARSKQGRQAEQRHVRHILVAVPEDADAATEQAARKKIEQARARIAQGEPFEQVAKEVSQDPGSASRGGDLGFIEPGMMDPAFDQAAFVLARGTVSDPVRSRFGYHLIEVVEVRQEPVKSFEEVKDELIAEYRKSESERLFYEWAERLSNLTYENPDSLVPAAEALGLKIRGSGWIGRTGGTGTLANPKVTAAAFSDDVMNQGNNSEIIEVSGEQPQALVLRVVDHEEASVKPLEDVRAQIVEALRVEAARAAAAESAQALVTDLTQGAATLEQAAGGHVPVRAGLVDRNDSQLPGAVLDKAFTLPAPAEGGRMSYGLAILRNGDAAVVALAKVEAGSLDALNEQQQAAQKKALETRLSRAYYQHWVNDMTSRANIEIAPSATGE